MASTQPVIGQVLPAGQAPDGNFYPLACSAPVSATGTLTSDNTNVADGATVVFTGAAGTITYVFRTALTGVTTERQVLIGADADGSLTNLRFSVNNGPMLCPYGTFGAVFGHAILFTANNDYEGSAGNTVGTTETSTHLSWSAVTLTGGIYGGLNVSNAAGSAIIGKVGIDQTTKGATNGVQPTQYTGIPSTFTIQTADQTVFTLAAGEIGFIQNLSSDAPLAVKKGASASTTSLNLILSTGVVTSDGKGGFVEINDWIGAVSVAKMTGTASYLAYKIAP